MKLYSQKCDEAEAIGYAHGLEAGITHHKPSWIENEVHFSKAYIAGFKRAKKSLDISANKI